MPVFSPDVSTFKIANIGEAVQAGQQINYNRLKNEAIGMDVQEAKDMLANRKKAAEIRKMYDTMPDQVNALEKAGLFEQADKLRGEYIKSRKSEVDLIESMRPGINQDNYLQIRQDLLQAGAIEPAMWPMEYSDEWFKKETKDRRGALSKLTRKWAGEGAIMTQDLVQGDGEILWEGKPYQDPDDLPADEAAAKAFTFKASDSNAIGKQSERLYGGFFDPSTGKIAGLDPAKAAKVAEVQAEAERIFAEGEGQVTHAIALAQAARKSGIRIRDSEDQSTSDPLGLRDALNPEPR